MYWNGIKYQSIKVFGMFHNENFVRKTEKREHERSIPFYTPLLYFLTSFPAFATEKKKLEKQPG